MTSKEAFKRLKFIADKELNTGSKSYKDLQEFWNYKEPLKVITDLVERDTPIKPQYGFNQNGKPDYICSACNFDVVLKERFCSHCGQRLLW